MDNKMSYRSPKSPLQSAGFSSSSAPPPLPNYDADDEFTLEFDVSSVVLPNGEPALDPAALKRIEEATRIMNELELETSTFSSEATSGSDKENENPSASDGDMEVEGVDEEDHFEVRSIASITDEDAMSNDSINVAINAETSASQVDKLDKAEMATRLKNANTKIWLLENIVKDQQGDIGKLVKINEEQARTIQALIGNKPEYEDIICGASPLSAEEGMEETRGVDTKRKGKEIDEGGQLGKVPWSTDYLGLMSTIQSEESSPISGMRREQEKRKRVEDSTDVSLGEAKRVKHKDSQSGSSTKGSVFSVNDSFDFGSFGGAAVVKGTDVEEPKKVQERKRRSMATTPWRSTPNRIVSADLQQQMKSDSDFIERLLDPMREAQDPSTCTLKPSMWPSSGGLGSSDSMSNGDEVDVHRWKPTGDLVQDAKKMAAKIVDMEE
ncbi:uncharacterized protein LY89DRAFT_432587 [Mollisia scopiformis]|uniref:Uncharacterized protein n=1 Tax=Mollisia scopiformis TaxID=149040 RepID=A0A194XMA4_MOLSC|nr:uncharacterized protein LY89DRAFT_432587 [Mollisia scopiformis]KUJ21380.1 hypothetical protein LY89DRAFT_432587 [Mollisia scopiformis]